MASSEVYWNGVSIGRNGTPAAVRADEEPGRLIADFQVPTRLVTPGRNVLSVKLSANHLWLPVRHPIHNLEAYAGLPSPEQGMTHYLPALLMLGLLAGAGVYFTVAAMGDRHDRNAALLACIAASGTLLLLAETSRAFVAYTYPWQLGRLAALAALTAVIAILIASYGSRRFDPPNWRRTTGLVMAATATILLFAPTFDLKSVGALFVGISAFVISAWRGSRMGLPGARFAWMAGSIILGLLVFDPANFLDRTYFLALAVLVMAVLVEQVGLVQSVKREIHRETLRAEDLYNQLLHTKRDGGESMIQLKDGATTHRLIEGDILYAKAAGDYCELKLKGDRALLITMTLSKLQASLPVGFIRIHKSYVANLLYVSTISPRRNGGQLLTLSDGSKVPVGRTYTDAVVSGIQLGAHADKMPGEGTAAPVEDKLRLD
jgi:MFS family permease